MASIDFIVLESGHRVRKPSSSNTVDFLSIKVGASGCEIKESATATGHFDLGAKRLTAVADPVNDQDAATKKYAVDTFIPLSQKAANSGVATLDAGGKIPVSQLPNSVMEYKGMWNASTNTPALANSGMDPAPSIGDVYKASVGGTVDFGAGNITFIVGDYAIFNGTAWELSHSGADAVISVNSQSGAVVLDTDDISEPGSPTNKWFTEARAQAAVVDDAIVDGVTGKAPSQNVVYDALAGKEPSISAGTTSQYWRGDKSWQTLDTDAVPEGANKYYSVAQAQSDLIETASISDGVTGKAPCSNLVYDALAGKSDVGHNHDGVYAPISHSHAISDVTGLQTALDDKMAYADLSKSKVNDNAGTISAGQIVYVKANGNVDLAKADVSALYDFDLGIVKAASIATTASGLITLAAGSIVSGFSSLTPGKMQYVSRATAGALTESLAGFVAGEHVYAVGRAISATEIVFMPMYEIEM